MSTEKPVRVQLSRKKGWRMPENTVSVARPGVFGNPYPVQEGRNPVQAVGAFEVHVAGSPGLREMIARKLPGKNLACWCPLCDAHKHGKPFGVQCDDCSPCHSDVLGDLANPADACGGNHA